MLNQKSKLTTIFLMIMMVFLLIAVVYVGRLLTTETEQSTIAPKKTKAAAVTYSKLIALNTMPDKNSSDTIFPTSEPTTIPTESVIPTFTITEALTPTTGVLFTPTPTEIILALNNPTVTKTASETGITLTTSPTVIRSLPDAGTIYQGLIIFAMASLLVFFSFLF